MIMIILWSIFPLRLFAESLTASVYGNGGFFTGTIGSMFSYLPYPNELAYTFWCCILSHWERFSSCFLLPVTCTSPPKSYWFLCVGSEFIPKKNIPVLPTWKYIHALNAVCAWTNARWVLQLMLKTCNLFILSSRCEGTKLKSKSSTIAWSVAGAGILPGGHQPERPTNDTTQAGSRCSGCKIRLPAGKSYSGCWCGLFCRLHDTFDAGYKKSPWWKFSNRQVWIIILWMPMGLFAAAGR